MLGIGVNEGSGWRSGGYTPMSPRIYPQTWYRPLSTARFSLSPGLPNRGGVVGFGDHPNSSVSRFADVGRAPSQGLAVAAASSVDWDKAVV